MFARLVNPLCNASRSLGYALAFHGSLIRDIDLVAVPWVTNAAEPGVLAEVIRQTTELTTGYCQMDPLEESVDWFRRGCPGMKPHGRLAWSFWLTSIRGCPYIDLSVVPPNPEADRAILPKVTRRYRRRVVKKQVPFMEEQY